MMMQARTSARFSSSPFIIRVSFFLAFGSKKRIPKLRLSGQKGTTENLA